MTTKTKIYRSLLVGTLPLAFFTAALAPANAEAQQRAVPSARADVEPVRSAIELKERVGKAQRFVLDARALRMARKGSRVRLDLTPERALEMTTIRKARLAGGRELVEGHIEGGGLPDGSATLVVNGNQVTGTIETPGGKTYRLRPVGGGRNEIELLDYKAMPKEHPPIEKVPAKVGGFQSQGPGGLPPAPPHPGNVQMGEGQQYVPTIDIIVGYSNGANLKVADMQGMIDLAVAETNSSFAASGINGRVHLLDIVPMPNFDDSRTYGQMVDALQTDTVLDARREALGADMVVMIVDNTAWCGMAPTTGAADNEYAVLVHWDCATGYYSFAHEIGHVVGADHDTDQGTNDFLSYGHALLNKRPDSPGLGWRTIMGYECDDGSCDQRIRRWSNPNEEIFDLALGTQTENNARVWNERIGDVAAFRKRNATPQPSPKAPGEVVTRGTDASPPARTSRPARRLPVRSSR